MSLYSRFTAFFRRRKLDADMAEEMRAHLELLTEEYVRRGLSPTEARHAAQREFGGVEQIKERARDQRGGRWLADLMQDARVGWRMLGRERGFTALCVLVVALGIGATTVIFSMVDAVLLRPLPIAEADRAWRVWSTNQARKVTSFSVSYPDYADWARRSTSWETLAAFDSRNVNLLVQGEPERLRAGVATHNALELLGWRVAHGRTFSSDDDLPGRGRVALLTEPLWRSRFGADPAIVGREIVIDAAPYAVVGVLAAGQGIDFGVEIVLPTALPTLFTGLRL
ncbi:MAG: ABC transporter permease, partial [Verrucomicrobiota bacterium]